MHFQDEPGDGRECGCGSFNFAALADRRNFRMTE